jgi:cytoskeletal protein CcmA (bactofilin family)
MPTGRQHIPTGETMDNKRISESFSDPGARSSICGATRITGTISGPGDLELDAELNGDVSVAGLLVLGEQASVQGKVTAGNMVMAGRVHGKVTVRERIEVRSSARMEGNIVCQKIAIAEGAFLDGEVHTHKGRPLAPDVFTEKRRDLQGAKAADNEPAK